MFNGATYPSMLSGSGYVVSRSAAKCLFQEALKVPYFHLEVHHTWYIIIIDYHYTTRPKGVQGGRCNKHRNILLSYDKFFILYN